MSTPLLGDQGPRSEHSRPRGGAPKPSACGGRADGFNCWTGNPVQVWRVRRGRVAARPSGMVARLMSHLEL